MSRLAAHDTSACICDNVAVHLSCCSVCDKRHCLAEMRAILIDLLLLLLMVVANDASGEMFTALVDMEQLLHAEHQVALHLRQFVHEQTQHLRQLALYVYVIQLATSRLLTYSLT